MSRLRHSSFHSNAVVCAAYAAGLLVALSFWLVLEDRHPIQVVFIADVAATVAVFLFAYVFDNSSLYDPYWSVAPIPIAIYWAFDTPNEWVNGARQALVITLVCIWGVRLTVNWWRGWGGLEHEDWRYVDIRDSAGPLYWLTSFVGIMLTPTILVFLGCLSIYPALAISPRPLGWLDLLATLVTAAAIALEAGADRQLNRFRASGPKPQDVLESGLWARSRHPNYLGEILFWWGLWLFGLAADLLWWWTIVGPLSISVLFRVVSLRMIEKRMLERRPSFQDLQQRVPILIPRMFRT